MARAGWPGRAQAGMAFAAGAVMAGGQAPLGLWPLTILGLAGLFALIGRVPLAGAAWTGLFGGAGYFALALSWLVNPFLVDAGRDGWMAPFAVALMAFGLGLFWAGAAAAGHALARPALRPVALALTFTLAEFLRGHVLTGFPWAMPGHAFIGTPLDQVAVLAGATGLTLLAALSAALPLVRRGPGLLAAAVLIGAAAVFGLWRLAEPSPQPRDITLRLVQPDAAQDLKWNPEHAAAFFDRLLTLSATEAAAPPDLVIWPETAVPYMLESDPRLAPLIGAAGRGAPVLTGIQRSEGARFWNSLVVIDASGAITASYDKHHLVPFGEYIPLGDAVQDMLGLSAFAARAGNGYSAGPGPQVIDLGGAGTVLPLICYEAVFPQGILRAPARPDWLLQITNDAWFGTLTGPQQHLAQARLRAAEQGLPLIRVANTGISAVIDARGRVLDSIPLGRAAYLDAALPGAFPPTPYARWGEWPLLLLLAGGGIGLLTDRFRSRA